MIDLEFNLVTDEASFARELEKANKSKSIFALWQRDMTAWPQGLSNHALDWLDYPDTMLTQVPSINSFVKEAHAAGLTEILLVATGVAAGFADMYKTVFCNHAPPSRLTVLNTTDADVLLETLKGLAFPQSLIIVADSSGDTLETQSLFRYLYQRALAALGQKQVGQHFVAITQHGSPLETLARRYEFRHTFLENPEVSDAFKTFSFLGLLPAALCGVDITALLQGSSAGAHACVPEAKLNPGLKLGTAFTTLIEAGRNKAALVLSPQLSALAPWLEGLLARLGIVVVLEPPELLGSESFCIYVWLAGEEARHMQHTRGKGVPVLGTQLNDLTSLPEFLFVWQVAITLATQQQRHTIFDDPGPHPSEVKQLLETYHQTGKLTNGSNGEAALLSAETLLSFLGSANPRDVVVLLAFLPKRPETLAALEGVRLALQKRLGLFTTLHFGSDYLHVLSPWYEGSKATSYVVQFVAEPVQTVLIPADTPEDKPLPFYVLDRAQVYSEKSRLEKAGKHVIYFNLGQRVRSKLEALATALQ